MAIEKDAVCSFCGREKDDVEKAVNIVMRFTNKEQAIDHYKNLGIKLLIDIQ